MVNIKKTRAVLVPIISILPRQDSMTFERFRRAVLNASDGRREVESVELIGSMARGSI